jgi:glutamate N-acetyltransferase/amino-acid N-acetyltransferase
MAKSPKPSITHPKGFRAAGATCGIKPSGKPDMAMILADHPCAAAAVFTKNRLPGAPVMVGRRHFRNGSAQAIVINSGIANDATGQQGVDNALATCKLVTQELTGLHISIKPRDVVPSSTGVIGPQLPMEKITRGVSKLVKKLARGPKADAAAARGIMTTDLTPKSANASLKLGTKTIRLGGIAKGSGMIAPNMATMLVFLTTDAAISPAMLKLALRQATTISFNRISVDQHTSPSDTVAVLASGLAGNRTITRTGKAFDAFTEKLTSLCNTLAYQIVKDGEGATRVFHVAVTGARSQREADRVAKAVVDSPLVKTAVHGSDPNWGRIVTAAGYSGAPINPAKLSLAIAGQTGKKATFGGGCSGGVCVFDHGVPRLLSSAQERRLETAMKQKDVYFTLNLGRGTAAVNWLGCDLSREYIRINADYTT